jgi:hypothetical protein
MHVLRKKHYSKTEQIGDGFEQQSNPQVKPAMHFAWFWT